MCPVTTPNGEAGDDLGTMVEAEAGNWRQAAELGDWQRVVEILAGLPAIEFDRVRAEAAKLLKCRTTTLTEEVEKARISGEGGTEGGGAAGRPLVFEEPEPWPAPVDPGALLKELEAAIRRHVSLPGEAALAVGLWAVMTHLVDRIEIAPRLLIKSPQPRCGKTTLLDLLACLVARPVPANNVTPAVVFRLIDRHRPTLLIDEADTFLRENEELRGAVNSGHRRSLAWVLRNVEVGGDWEPRQFSTWCAMAIAGIGRQHATIEDRSVVIELQRRLAGERIERLDDEARDRLRELGRKIARLVRDFGPIITSAKPREPEGLHDRAADNWRPLLAIAELAGEAWAGRAREAAKTLSGGDDAETPGAMLLADIHEIFHARKNPPELSSSVICDELAKREDRPWPEISRGKPVTGQKLAAMLRPFGVRAVHRRTGYVYRRSDLEAVWKRYLPDTGGNEPSHRHDPNGAADSDESQTVTDGARCDGSLSGANPTAPRVCDGVTVHDPGADWERETDGTDQEHETEVI